METRRTIVSGDNVGMRLDAFLVHRLLHPLEGELSEDLSYLVREAGRCVHALKTWTKAAGLSRSAVQRLITSGQVTVNGRKTKASVKLKSRDRIEIQWAPPVDAPLEAEPLFLPILYEDNDLIVVNKPPGMVVHPAAGNPRGTLVNALLHHCPNLQGIGGERRPGIVHRLDKDTSGVMVVAKNEMSFHRLALQFQERRVIKEYVAFVWGRVEPRKGTIERPIGRHRRDRKRMSSIYPLSRSRHAITQWEVERFFHLDPTSGSQGWVTLLRVRPHTGRTHQIRVHLADQGYPIIKDMVYGKKGLTRGKNGLPAFQGIVDLPRQALHAERLRLIHPRSGAPLDLEAPWFPDMDRLLEVLQQKDLVNDFL